VRVVVPTLSRGALLSLSGGKLLSRRGKSRDAYSTGGVTVEVTIVRVCTLSEGQRVCSELERVLVS